MIGDRLNLSARPNWRERAACKGKPSSWFFPPNQGRYPTYYRWQPPREALELCAGCPVRVECERAGRGEYGLWGGVVHSERGNRRFKIAEEEKPPEPAPVRVRSRSHICDGCGRGFLNNSGLVSHQKFKPCGKKSTGRIGQKVESFGWPSHSSRTIDA